MQMVELRFAATRIRRLREAHKLTKAELTRRAALKPSEYLRFEPPTTKRRYGLVRVTRVPLKHLEQLAIALGTTPAYIARGNTDAKAVPPNHPARAMIAEMERFGRQLRNALKREEKLQSALEEARREASIAGQFNAALEAQRLDDAEYILELVSPTVTRRSITLDAVQQAQEAAYRMKEGKPARPVEDEDLDEDAEDDEDEGCPKGDPDCLSRDDECHDACEAPTRGPVAEYFATEDRR